MPDLSWSFRAIAAATALGIPLYAWRIRGRGYAIFSAVLLGVSLPGALIVHARLLERLPPHAALWLNVAFTALMAAR